MLGPSKSPRTEGGERGPGASVGRLGQSGENPDKVQRAEGRGSRGDDVRRREGPSVTRDASERRAVASLNYEIRSNTVTPIPWYTHDGG